MIVTAGAINKSVYFYIVGDASHASPGDPLTGLLFSDIETGGSASYARQGAARTDLTLITLASASATHADGGFIEVDATNMPGVYRCDIPDAAWSTGADQVIVDLVAASANNAAIAPIYVDIADFDIRTANVTLAAATHTGAVIPTVTTLTNLPSITANWLTATGIATSALDGKGDWTVGKTGYSLTQAFPANFASTAITAGGVVSADSVAISGDTVAADNLELQYDTTGLSGDTFPSSQSQLSGLANVGSAVHKPTESYTLTTGTQSVGTFSVTESLDGSYHTHTDASGAIDYYYEFSIGSGAPSSVQVTGYVNGGNDDIGIYGYDWVSTSYKQIGTLSGKNNTSNEVNSFDLFVDMVGSGANEGIVRVRFYTASGLTSATVAVDQIFLAFSQGSEGYEAGAVWVNTNASNTNTVVGIDGVARNPVSTIAATNTLLASTKLVKIEISPSSAITLVSAQIDQVFIGHGWTLALGGQNINNSHFFNADVSGVGTAATKAHFHDCVIGTASLQKADCMETGFNGTVTQTLAGDYNYVNCHSDIAGSGSPIFTKTAGQTITAEYRRWSGGITISGLESGDVITVGGEMGTITLNGADATVEIRGSYKSLVNNLTGSPTVNIDGAFLAADIASVLTDTNELQTDWTNGGRLDLILDIIAQDTTTDIPALINGLNDVSTTQVLTQINAALDTAISELGVAAPTATPTLRTGLMLMYMALRNKTVVQTSGTDALEIYNNAGTKITSKALTDDGSDLTESKMT